MVKLNIQKFASGPGKIKIIWNDNNDNKKVRPKSITIDGEMYTPSDPSASEWIINTYSTNINFSELEKNYDYYINPLKLKNGQDVSNKRIYLDFGKYLYNDYNHRFVVDYPSELWGPTLDFIGIEASENGDKAFITGTVDTLLAKNTRYDGVYWAFLGESEQAWNDYILVDVNIIFYSSKFFPGSWIGSITNVDTSCPLYNVMKLEGGFDSVYDDNNNPIEYHTIICDIKDYYSSYGFAIQDGDESNYPYDPANFAKGARIGSRDVLEIKKGNSLVKTFHDWREPKLGDDLNGQTIKIVYPSSKPIYNTGYETSFLNNEYIVTDGDYMIRETGTYDQVDGASDYSWVIEDYIYSIEIVGRGSDGYFTESVDTIYKTTTRIKTTYGSGGNPTQEIQSQTEDIRKKETTLPSDIGTFVSITSNMGITFQVDDLRISTKSYSLQSLQGTDNLQNKMILISSFPTNIDKVWFPSLPSMNEYGQFAIPSQYTLFSGEKDFSTDYYVYMISVSIWPTFDMQGQPSAPYSFIISGQNMGGSSTICAKTYGSSDVDTWNKPIIPNQAPQSYTLAEAGLKTSSPLYPYIKKLVWDE